MPLIEAIYPPLCGLANTGSALDIRVYPRSSAVNAFSRIMVEQ